jgi:hypothetical protein
MCPFLDAHVVGFSFNERRTRVTDTRFRQTYLFVGRLAAHCSVSFALRSCLSFCFSL